MFKWFMAKTLVTKIIIVTSSVVIIGGATAGAIIIPKQIEIKKEEQRQEQIRLENEEDMANISIKLSKEKISIPYKGVTQGITIERYEKLDEAIPYEEGEILDKAELTEVLKELFVESYTGGELTVDFDENINGYTKRGDYPITFTVTSEKGNTKSETAIIEVYNYYRPSIYFDKNNITITKGTAVDIMEGVNVDSILSKEEQGEIKAEGTVDVNTVGTYTIKYTYIPKEGLEGEPIEGDNKIRTYKVVEKPSVKLNTTYRMEGINPGDYSTLIFKSATEFRYQSFGGYPDDTSGTYTVNGNKVVLKASWGEKNFIINNKNNTFDIDPDYWDINV